ncbi:hypothetical protein [Ensifer sp. YR511]|uniref:hypothetical protein n=1 Tax=Ensifer sp. YR511 TaxID=1855294 RepID=UPI00087ED8CA|nr:hypothetical protein [Ensifer sp. YR511]SDO11000.1 VirD5 protein [Ensifer sp. YR511]
MLNPKKTSNDLRHASADDPVAPAEAAIWTSTLDLRNRKPSRGTGRGWPLAAAPERELGPANSARSDGTKKRPTPSRAAQQAGAAETTHTTHTLDFNKRHDGLDSASDAEYFSAKEDLKTDPPSASQMGSGIYKSAAGISNSIGHGTAIQGEGSPNQGPDVPAFQNLKLYNSGGMGAGSHGAGHGAAIQGEKFFGSRGPGILDLRKPEVHNARDTACGRPAAVTEGQRAGIPKTPHEKNSDPDDSLVPSSDDEYGDWDITEKQAQELERAALAVAQMAPSVAIPAAGISNTVSHGSVVQREGLSKYPGPSVSDLRNHPYLKIGEASERPAATTEAQRAGLAQTSREETTNQYDSLVPCSNDEYGVWDITEEDAQKLEKAALAAAQSHRGDAGPADGISNAPTREAVVYALPEMVNRASSSLPAEIKSGALGTYGNRENERNRLGIGPAGDFEAEHILPYNALHRNVSRKSRGAKALEKKMPAYLEVKKHHRKHPATGNTGKDRVEAGWPTGDSCRTDMGAMLSDPVARAEGTSASNIYQISALGYAAVLAEMRLQSDTALGATYQIRVATVSYNHTVKSNPALELPGGSRGRETLRLDPNGQAEAVLAREAATTGRWPSRERQLEVYSHFLDQDNAIKIQRPSAVPQAPQSVRNSANRLNSAGEPSKLGIYRPSRADRERERSKVSGR